MRKFLILNHTTQVFLSMKAKDESELRAWIQNVEPDLVKYTFYELVPVHVGVRKVIDITRIIS